MKIASRQLRRDTVNAGLITEQSGTSLKLCPQDGIFRLS